jgi:hypothetical protein
MTPRRAIAKWPTLNRFGPVHLKVEPKRFGPVHPQVEPVHSRQMSVEAFL